MQKTPTTQSTDPQWVRNGLRFWSEQATRKPLDAHVQDQLSWFRRWSATLAGEAQNG